MLNVTKIKIACSLLIKFIKTNKALKTTLKMCESMAKQKADYVLILTPSFYKNRMTDMALFKYFKKVKKKIIFYFG